MKVRFYRGPWDGKIRVMKDTAQEVTVYSNKNPMATLWNDSQLNPEIERLYLYRRTNCTHPDGSVYFEWDRPKGSRF